MFTRFSTPRLHSCPDRAARGIARLFILATVAGALTCGGDGGPTEPKEKEPEPDTTPPTLSSLTVAADSVAVGRSTRGSVEASDNEELASITLEYADGCPAPDETKNVSGASLTHEFLVDMQGPECANPHLMATDTAGNSSTPLTIPVTSYWHHIAQDVQLSNPADTIPHTGTLEGTLVAPQGFDSVYAIIGDERTTFAAADTVLDLEVSYELTEVGTTPVVVRAWAPGDRTSAFESDLHTLEFPNAPPELDCATTDTLIPQDSAASFTCDVTDDRGVEKLIVYDADTTGIDTLAAGGSTSETLTWEYAPADTGSFTFLFEAEDDLNERSEMVSLDGIVDGPPTISGLEILGDSLLSYQDNRFAVTSEDRNLESLVVGCTLGCEDATISSPTGTDTASVYFPEPGEGQVRVRMTDSFGQQTDSAVDVTVQRPIRRYGFRMNLATRDEAGINGGQIVIEQTILGESLVDTARAQVGDTTYVLSAHAGPAEIYFEDSQRTNRHQAFRLVVGDSVLGPRMGVNWREDAVSVFLPNADTIMEGFAVPDSIDNPTPFDHSLYKRAVTGGETTTHPVLCPSASLSSDPSRFVVPVEYRNLPPHFDNRVDGWGAVQLEDRISLNHMRQAWSLQEVGPDYEGVRLLVVGSDDVGASGQVSWTYDPVTGCRTDLVFTVPTQEEMPEKDFQIGMLRVLFFGYPDSTGSYDYLVRSFDEVEPWIPSDWAIRAAALGSHFGAHPDLF